MATKPLIVIVGETASGKSAIAMDIARKFDGEIIGADSWTVYREFDIGTAKPSKEEFSEIPHHLFNIVDAKDGFNTALYKGLAKQAITNIQNRGKLPVLVGGTGLYIDSVLFDFEFLPAGDPLERDRLNSLNLDDILADANTKGISLESIDIRNKRRIIRAIETGGQTPKRSPLRSNTFVFGIKADRETLKSKISMRVDNMIKLGLEDEVRMLSEKYGWDVEPMKGIGYYQWRDYFSGSQTLSQTYERIISSTINLAKRQRTWFKRNNSIQWLNNGEELVETITTLLNKNN